MKMQVVAVIARALSRQALVMAVTTAAHCAGQATAAGAEALKLRRGLRV
jgi:hypothetical protein